MNPERVLPIAAAILLFLPLPALAQSPPQPPKGVEAVDLPDDDGKGILVSWEVSPDDVAPLEFSVEVALDGQLGGEVARVKAPTARYFELRDRKKSERSPEEAAEMKGLDAWVTANSGLLKEKEWPFWGFDKAAFRRYEKNGSGDWVRIDLRRLVSASACLVQLPGEAAPAKQQLEAGQEYAVRVVALRGGQSAPSGWVKVSPVDNIFSWKKLNNLVYAGIFSAIILFFIGAARKKTLFLRRIPGLDAVEEAIGRATEMGRPIYYLTGRDNMTSVSTIAATIILGEIAKKVAAYDTQIKVPHTDAVVMAVCQEIVKEAYLEAGRPDAYNPDSNFYITDDQFSYTAAVDGLMVREKPAACFFMGYYYAEALLLAETGAGVGAIQIAGTDADAQLPFFVTACDYTLIGEELYAASAYLSRDPVLVGTHRGQDVGKGFIMAVVIAGTAFVTVAGLAAWSPESGSAILDLIKQFGG